MRAIADFVGPLLLIAGAFAIGFYWFVFKTTVDGIYNAGLISDRETGMLGGIALLMSGFAMLILSQLIANSGRRSSSSEPS